MKTPARGRTRPRLRFADAAGPGPASLRMTLDPVPTAARDCRPPKNAGRQPAAGNRHPTVIAGNVLALPESIVRDLGFVRNQTLP